MKKLLIILLFPFILSCATANNLRLIICKGNCINKKEFSTINLPNRGTIAYKLTGNGSETIVLLNGAIFNFHQWEKEAIPFLKKEIDNCQFLQYDPTGIGHSSFRNSSFSIFDVADELNELLDSLGIQKVHLIGVSMGALVGQAFYIKYPEKAISFCGMGNPNINSPSIGKLVEGFKMRITAMEEIRQLWGQRIDKNNFSLVFNKVYIPLIFFKEYEILSRKEKIKAMFMKRVIYSALEGTYLSTMVECFSGFIHNLDSNAEKFSIGLPKSKEIPILLINGTSDTTAPIEMTRELMELMPWAKFVEIDGINHMGPMMIRSQTKLAFSHYLDFLKEVRKGN